MAYAFSGVPRSLLHEGKTNCRGKSIIWYKTRSMKSESTGGVDANGVSGSYPVLSEAIDFASMLTHCTPVEASVLL